jgi:UDP-N-acetyl-D-mannosaminuronate dehydrogenase
VRRSRVSVLGIDHGDLDLQTFPSEQFVGILKKKGMVVRVFDPQFSYNELTEMGYSATRTLKEAIEGADCLVIASPHDHFKNLSFNKIKFLVKQPSAIVDLARVIDPLSAEREGFIYLGFGRGV